MEGSAECAGRWRVRGEAQMVVVEESTSEVGKDADGRACAREARRISINSSMRIS